MNPVRNLGLRIAIGATRGLITNGKRRDGLTHGSAAPRPESIVVIATAMLFVAENKSEWKQKISNS